MTLKQGNQKNVSQCISQAQKVALNKHSLFRFCLFYLYLLTNRKKINTFPLVCIPIFWLLDGDFKLYQMHFCRSSPLISPLKQGSKKEIFLPEMNRESLSFLHVMIFIIHHGFEQIAKSNTSQT